MKQIKPYVAALCALLAASPVTFAQSLDDRAPKLDTSGGHWYSRFTRNYTPRVAPGISLSNSGRVDSLIRAGNLYLSLNDAIALALENNIDVEVSRYSYPINESALRASRATACGQAGCDPIFSVNQF